ncbi:MAG: DUF72 domain-containing protein [Pedobacter sp.]|nr:DUF72 domain-containing protein [Pedobacter sp.]
MEGMKKQGKIFIGTSGWKYKHWDDVFYPKMLKKSDQLNYYHHLFNTVELNNSFYRQPEAHQFAAWKMGVPDDFIFAVKANRFFTHLKKLNVTESDVLSFLDQAAHLEQKLGPILFQLPPSWKINLQRLENFLNLLPKNYRYTFEFRNHTWYGEELYRMLANYNCAFCIYELAGHLSPLPITADFTYVRLHGPGDKYQGSYTTKALEKWANFAKDASTNGKDVYIYFDNDQAGYAAYNAQELKKIIADILNTRYLILNT